MAFQKEVEWNQIWAKRGVEGGTLSILIYNPSEKMKKSSNDESNKGGGGGRGEMMGGEVGESYKYHI